jgi:prepilin-type N-terminal cleavage/methylation domain-containing protein
MRRKAGFTLIELLVVIAIIALLIGILLPALRRARDTSRTAVSLSNCRQILLGAHTYRFDKKDQLPMRGCGYNAGRITGGWDTWSYGGKNNYNKWATVNGGAWDESAYSRPLNEYLYSDVKIDRPPGYINNQSASWTFSHGLPTQNDRDTLQLPAFRSPGDKITYQGSVDPGIPYGAPNASRSSYDDVGTSYHFNIKWWDQLYGHVPAVPDAFTAAFNEGVRRERLASEYDPTGKFVWIHDQTSDVVANASSVMGEFGDKNKSVMAYLDGRAEYNLCQVGLMYDLIGQNIPGQRRLGKYTFVFVLPGQGGLPNANTGLYP